MRACIVTEAGALEFRDLPLPAPRAGEIRVRVRAFGVNRADLLQRRGLYPAPAGLPSDTLGLEFAGEVDDAGPTGRRPGGPVPGERVMGLAAGGAYAEYVVVPAGHVTPIPRDYSFAEAAAVPEAFVTAYDALERVDLSAGEWVLVHAVGSGVGTAALQLARARGARCAGTSRTPAKLRRAVELGLDLGLDPALHTCAAEVRRVTGEGVHAVVDLVGGPAFSRTLELLRPRGRLVLVGLTAGRTAEVDLGLLLRQRLRIEGTVLRSRSVEEKTELVARFRTAVLPLLETRAVRPIVDRVFPFSDVETAHAIMDADQNFGKLVVEVP